MAALLAVIETLLHLQIEGWMAAEKQGLARFDGNQHNPSWHWHDVPTSAWKTVLQLYLEHGALRRW